MRFLADMGIDLRVVKWLRSIGHDVIHLREEGLHRITDAEMFEKSVEDNRIIMTFDLDSEEIDALSKGRKAGLILFRLRNIRTPHLLDRLSTALEDTTDALSDGAVVVVEDLILYTIYNEAENT